MEYLTEVQNDKNLKRVIMEAINKVHTVDVDVKSAHELDYINEHCDEFIKEGLMTITFKGRPILELLRWEDNITEFKYRFI